MGGVDLKPCPFCGGEAVLTGHQAPEFWVHCPAIGCKASTEAFGSQDRAIAAWNTRTPDAAGGWEREALENLLSAKINQHAGDLYWGFERGTSVSRVIVADIAAAILAPPMQAVAAEREAELRIAIGRAIDDFAGKLYGEKINAILAAIRTAVESA